MLGSFNVASLIAQVPIDGTLRIITERYHLEDYMVNLLTHCLKNAYFIGNDERYKQIHGAPTGSPLFPTIANLFICKFRRGKISNHPPNYKYEFVAFVTCSHRQRKLRKFLNHLNREHRKLKFTMET